MCGFLILSVVISLPLSLEGVFLIIFYFVRSFLEVTIFNFGKPRCSMKVDLQKAYDSVN